MTLAPAQIERIVQLVRTWYPDWSSVTDPRFDKDEVAPKKKAAAKAADLLNREALVQLRAEERHDEIVRRLRTVAGASNLLYLANPAAGDLAVLHDPRLDQPSFTAAFTDLLHGDGASPERLERYLAYVRERDLKDRWPFPTYYLFLLHPDTDLFVKPAVTRDFLERLGLSGMLPPRPSGGAYSFLLSLARSIRDGLHDFGARDMVDVHSVLWVAGRAKEVSEPPRPPEEPQPVQPQMVVPQPGARYWMLSAGEGARLWEEFQAQGLIAIGWDYLGDLRQYADQEAIANAILAYRGGEGYPINDSLACYQFANEMQVGDAVLVKRGLTTFVGYGVVTGEYEHDPAREEYHHTRRVQWLSAGEWAVQENRKLPSKTLTDITPLKQLLGHILPQVTRGLPAAPPPSGPLQPPYTLEECAVDTGVPVDTLRAWVEAIERKRQAIVYGPPGTGKTWTARHFAQHLVQLSDGFVELVQFHPSYAYEDFIQGIRPESAADGTLSYPLRAGRFLEFCETATRREGRCVLIVDEINRGNLSRIFGELMFLLEYRDQTIPLASGNRFRIPANVRLIGTMNTADRSIALVDHALRRRFAFLPLYPDFGMLSKYHGEDNGLVSRLTTVLTEINELISDPHYALGVSYFLTRDLAGNLESIWRMEIEPYLEEQFFDRRERVDRYRWSEVRERFGL